MKLQVKILDEKMKNNLPQYGTSGSAGLDLNAVVDESYTIQPGETKLISSGISIFIDDPQYAAMILPRSGLGAKNGIVLGNLVGLIDSDYQGPLMVPLWNRSSAPYVIEPMARIAQLIIVPVARVDEFQVVDEFKATDRGTGGFGSTGVN